MSAYVERRWVRSLMLALVLTLIFTTRGIAFATPESPAERADVPIQVLKSEVVRVPVSEGEDIRFEHLTSLTGLSQTRIAQIVQDDRGFLWFGTQHGVNRYDGYTFRAFTHDPERSDSLSGSFIQALFKDRSGAIWVGTDQSLDRFDAATESFAHYHLNAQDPTVYQITQDEEGTLWLATFQGLYRLDPVSGKIVRYGHDGNDSSTLSSDNVQSSGLDRTGRFWVITRGGLDQFDRAAGKVRLHIQLPDFDAISNCESSCSTFHEDRFGVFWLIGDGVASLDLKTGRLFRYEGGASPVSGIISLLDDDEGTMWFGSNLGLLKFDRANQSFIRYRRSPTAPTSLAENRLTTLFEDREKTIWVGFNAMTPDHFARARPVFEQFLPRFVDPDSPSEELVGTIYEDRDRRLWISVNEAVGRKDRKTGEYVRFHPGKPGDGASTILQDETGTMWFGAGGVGLVRMDAKTGRFSYFKHPPRKGITPGSDWVSRIFLDRKGVMWVNTLDGLNRFDRATGRFTVYKQNPDKPEPYWSVSDDRYGFLWLGSQTGLVRFEPSTGQFSVFKHNPADQRSLSDNVVDSVFEDHAGTLWIGTQDGLNRLDRETLTFSAFYKKDGLAGNVVSCILGDDRGNLWMSTNEGISSFNPQTRKFKNYSMEDGLPGNDLTGMDACYRSQTGEMFFGGFAGAVAFFPEKLSDNPYVPSVVFTDLRISHAPVAIGPHSPLKRSITYTDALTLSANQNFFSIEFTALSFRSPATNRYRYRLEGSDPDWHEVGSLGRTVNFTALAPGDYGLVVQGATSRASWSEGTRLHITVLPPWWATWWFRSIYGAVIMLAVWSAYLYRLRQITQEFNVRLEGRVSERTRLARDLHDTLLQSFQGLILRLQAVEELLPPGRVKEAMDQALERADQAIAEGRSAVFDLRASTTTTNDLAQALTCVADELAGEHSPSFRLVVEGSVRELQPIVRDEVYGIGREALRNAFIHARARTVEAELSYEHRVFRLRIRDEGAGIPQEILADGRSGHYGLNGMRERASQTGGKLEIWSGVGAGTEIDLSIPGSIAYLRSPKGSRWRLFHKGKG